MNMTPKDRSRLRQLTSSGIHPPSPSTSVGERHRRRHQAQNQESTQTTLPSSRNTGREGESEESRAPKKEQSSEGHGSFPQKIGTNEWLHADGRVYKKLMFVIRKDQSQALNLLLAGGNSEFGSDRSEIIRTLLDQAGIRGENR